MVRKKGIVMHCTKWQQPGHNKRKCTQPATRAQETQPEVPPVPAVQRQRRQPPTPVEP
ncbi:hypothetical protein LINGRAHAP2_LOCUS19855, partial [Linum grandiflorum]